MLLFALPQRLRKGFHEIPYLVAHAPVMDERLLLVRGPGGQGGGVVEAGVNHLCRAGQMGARLVRGVAYGDYIIELAPGELIDVICARRKCRRQPRP